MNRKLDNNIDGMLALLIFIKGVDPDTAYKIAEGQRVTMHDIAKNIDFYQANKISAYKLAKTLGLNKGSLSSIFSRAKRKKELEHE